MAKSDKKKKKRPARRRRSPTPTLDPNGIDVSFEESRRDYELQCEEGLFADDFDPHQMVLAMHPDFVELLSNGGQLPETLTNNHGDVWSPSMHLGMHGAVESQLVQNQPEGIFELACDLEREGKIGSHQIRHAIMDVFARTIYDMQKNGELFDDEAYLKKIPDSYRIYAQ